MEPPLPKIAVVDDDQDITEMLEIAFTALGAAVVSILPTGSILEHLQAAHPALVILDMRMPPTDGVTILVGMRGLDGLAHIPVVFFTSSVADVLAALPVPAEMGAELVAKPDVGRLIACVQARLPSLSQ